MTLVAAWIRKTNSVEELVVASDSRLRFGCKWDSCPKIMPLARGDSVLCFAGDTMYAYPLILQAVAWANDNHRASTRAQDIADLTGHLRRVFGHMLEQITDLPHGHGDPLSEGTEFLLAGFSWKHNRFMAWHLALDLSARKCVIRRRSLWHSQDDRNQVLFVGDEVRTASSRTRALRGDGANLDYEPLDVLRDLCRDDNFPSIGGPPQLVKVYRHMNTMAYGVYWPTKTSERLTVLGRPLLEYERTQRLAIDLETHATLKLWDYLDTPATKSNVPLNNDTMVSE